MAPWGSVSTSRVRWPRAGQGVGEVQGESGLAHASLLAGDASRFVDAPARREGRLSPLDERLVGLDVELEGLLPAGERLGRALVGDVDRRLVSVVRTDDLVLRAMNSSSRRSRTSFITMSMTFSSVWRLVLRGAADLVDLVLEVVVLEVEGTDVPGRPGQGDEGQQADDAGELRLAPLVPCVACLFLRGPLVRRRLTESGGRTVSQRVRPKADSVSRTHCQAPSRWYSSRVASYDQ